MNPFLTHGAISWPELSTSDPAAASEFYSSVCGWSTAVMPMPDGDYRVGQVEGGGVCGIMAQPRPDTPIVWTLYVTVTDVHKSTKFAEELGATVFLPPMQVPSVGTFAGIMDPQGAAIMLITYDPDDQDNQSPEIDFVKNGKHHGVFSWFELRTSDAEAALIFYGKLFGWESEIDMTGMGPYHMISVGGVGIGGAVSPPMGGAPPHWGAYITVDDIDVAVKAVKASGGQVGMEPIEIGHGRIAMIQDPQGARVSLVQYK